jgi:hypothetical protein
LARFLQFSHPQLATKLTGVQMKHLGLHDSPPPRRRDLFGEKNFRMNRATAWQVGARNAQVATNTAFISAW